MEKLFCMLVASVLTGAANRGALGGMSISPDLSDKNLQALNSQVWEQFRVFHTGVVNALESTNWPTPKLPPGNLGAGLAGLVADVLKTGPLATIAERLLKAIPVPPAFSGPLPSSPELPVSSGVKS